jgi:hypothetical protein
MADFIHAIKMQAVTDSGASINFAKAHTITGILHVGRGRISSGELAIPDGPHDFFFMSQANGDSALVLTNDDAETMDVHLTKGYSFTMQGPAAFTETSNAADKAVLADEFLATSNVGSHGSTFDFITLNHAS